MKKTIPTNIKRLSVYSGVTLVELLVAMVIGLFIVSGVVTVMSQGKDKFLLEQELSLIQENARFAEDELLYEIRMAGYNGCGGIAKVTNVLNHSGNWAFSGEAVMGYSSSDANASLDIFSSVADHVVNGSDVLILSRGDQDDSLTIRDHRPKSANFKTTAVGNYAKGQILMLAALDCSMVGIFELTSPNVSANSETLVHNTASGGTASGPSNNGNGGGGNCSKNLSFNGNCSNAPAPNEHGQAFPDGSLLMTLRSAAYFVRKSPITGQPTLYRQLLKFDRATEMSTTEAQELLPGVEKMEILFGADTLGEDGVPDQFFRPENMPTNSAGKKSWEKIVSVRLLLTLISSRKISGVEETSTGSGSTGSDYLRKEVSISARIRNRLNFTVSTVSSDESTTSTGSE